MANAPFAKSLKAKNVSSHYSQVQGRLKDFEMSSAAVRIMDEDVEPAVQAINGDAHGHDDQLITQSGSASPVHMMQARLEEAVFASFSAKEAAPARRGYRGRAMVITLAAALGGWALLMGGVALKIL